MPFHMRSHDQISDPKLHQTQQQPVSMKTIGRPGEKPQPDQAIQSQADAAQSHASPSKPRHRNHRFKPHSVSTGNPFKQSHSATHLVKTTAEGKGKNRAMPFPYPIAKTNSSTTVLSKSQSQLKNDRNLVGQCAACEESLEHKLSGEKVIQFSCGHVAHEECLYELIRVEDEEQVCPECEEPLELDASRGGSILDLNKLTSMVRSIGMTPGEMSPTVSSFVSAETWKSSPLTNGDTLHNEGSSSTHNYFIDEGHSHGSKPKTPTTSSHPLRRLSDVSDVQHTDDQSLVDRKHGYDLSSTESKVKQTNTTKGIPRPKVTIRSEFPTLTRSSQQQSLTCLVTVEVPTTRTMMRQIGAQHPLSTTPRLSTESPKALDAIAEDLKARVGNWHGLETDKFGPLRLHNNLKVGRDGTNWQKLDCFMFSDLLICVREKMAPQPAIPGVKPKFQLKGSILIRNHLKDVSCSPDELILTLNLTVATLPTFRLKFTSREQLDVWRLGLLQLEVGPSGLFGMGYEHDTSSTEDDEDDDSRASDERPSSISSSNHSGSNSVVTAPTDYADASYGDLGPSSALHIPMDVVVVIPISSAMQGLKIKLLKDALRFIITQLSEHDRMGLVTFGANGGANPLVSMATKDWCGWRDVYRSIKPTGQKALRADPIEGANVAMDLLSQREDANPISSILLISDSPANETDNMDFVVKRAHKANVSIHAFGLGQTHKADTLIEISSRTNAPYTYVKDWMMLRECVAGCLGSLQSISHTSAKLKLKIPEGSIARFVKVSGALHSKRASGRDAEAILGDLRFGDKRDVLVQLSVEPDAVLKGEVPHDPWESIVSSLATLGGSLDDNEPRVSSMEEIPLIQADLSYGDMAKGGAIAHLSHPSLLTIALLPENPKAKRSSRGSIIPPMPSHPSIVQRRMEILTSDMVGRALTLTSKGQHENAHRLLAETRTILQGLGKGNLPPLPPVAARSAHSRSSSEARDGHSTPKDGRSTPKDGRSSPRIPQPSSGCASPKVLEERRSNQSLARSFSSAVPRSAASIDPKLLRALDADIEACIEFITHPAVFSHDAKKAALQTIGVISSQRGYTFRTDIESLWAGRIKGIRRMGEITKDWQMVGNDTLTEEM